MLIMDSFYIFCNYDAPINEKQKELWNKRKNYYLSLQCPYLFTGSLYVRTLKQGKNLDVTRIQAKWDNHFNIAQNKWCLIGISQKNSRLSAQTNEH